MANSARESTPQPDAAPSFLKNNFQLGSSGTQPLANNKDGYGEGAISSSAEQTQFRADRNFGQGGLLST